MKGGVSTLVLAQDPSEEECKAKLADSRSQAAANDVDLS